MPFLEVSESTSVLKPIMHDLNVTCDVTNYNLWVTELVKLTQCISLGVDIDLTSIVEDTPNMIVGIVSYGCTP